MSHTAATDTVVIGAGPFGLSVAAHLRAAGVNFRIFGRPMNRWQRQMPAGMFLKSEGRASSLSEPSGEHTLDRFCARAHVPYDARAIPISIETFTSYALAFQRDLVPDLEEVLVSRVEALNDRFAIALQDGRSFEAKHVIVATGLEHTEYIPPEFGHLPRSLVSHSSAHRSFDQFAGRHVTVIGGGQSALETAALLHEQGADVRIVLRKAALEWNRAPRLSPRSFYGRLRHPLSNLGEGFQLWVYSNMPQVFHCLPGRLRIWKAKTVLAAAGAWWLRGRVENRIPVIAARSVQSATEREGGLALGLRGRDGEITEVTTDHVIAATGYRYDVRRLPFLSEGLKERLRLEEHRPVLSFNMESTVPGLYFTGIATANQFGPSMRFIDGVRHTASVISRHIGALQKQPAGVPERQAASASS